MSNRQSNINQAIRKQELLLCFREAFEINDSRNRRTAIGNVLRLATMYEVDDTLMLFYALKEKYEPQMLDEIQPLASSTPKPQCREAMGASLKDDLYQCESCQQEFSSAKALAGHGPQRCYAKNHQLT